MGFTVLMAILSFLGGLIALRCPWCGTWFPLFKSSYKGKRWCKKCGRNIFTLF